MKTPREARAARPAPRAALAPAGDATPAGDGRAAWALLISLALVVVARAILTFAPGMAWWGLNPQRFLAPPLGWGAWAVMAVALLPPVARRAAPALEALGNGLLRPGARGPLLAALGGVVLVALLPDRAWFVGDLFLRQNTLEAGANTASWYPQALPLDILIHDRLARWLMGTLGLDANGAGRLIGAGEAGALAAAAVAFARALALQGAAGLAAVAIVFFGGWLTIFTGLDKAFTELTVIVPTAAALALGVARTGRGLLRLGAALALAFLLHRSGVALIPFAVLAWVLWARGYARAGGWRRPGALVATALPIAALAYVAPRVLALATGFDARHFAPDEVRAQGGALAAAFAGARLRDDLNLALAMSPLALTVPALLIVAGRRAWADRAAALLVALALPLLGMSFFLHPGQGLTRDLDVFAPTFVALALPAAWRCGAELRGTRAFVAAPVIAVAALWAVQWLALAADEPRSLARVEALVAGPPARPPLERYTMLQFLGARAYREERWADAARAYEAAAGILETPNILRQWGAAESQAGAYDRARMVFGRELARDPNDLTSWLGLAVAAYRLRDTSETRRAGEQVLRLDSTNVEVREVLRSLDAGHAAPPGR